MNKTMPINIIVQLKWIIYLRDTSYQNRKRNRLLGDIDIYIDIYIDIDIFNN